jgi:tetratricopeptide (TPR) repeat protein
MDNMTKELDEALSFARNEDYVRALEICDLSVKSNPDLPDGFRTRSQIYARKGDFGDAVNDITNAILKDEPAPADYFFRGWWNLENTDLSASIEDLTAAIALGEQLDFHYYDESAFFFRSIAYLRSSRFDDALSDCNHVRDDFEMYLHSGQVSKVQIVSEAKSKTET